MTRGTDDLIDWLFDIDDWDWADDMFDPDWAEEEELIEDEIDEVEEEYEVYLQ